MTSKEITIDRGRVLIPMQTVIDYKFKQPFKALCPAATWSGPKLGQWQLFATPDNVTLVNTLFGTHLSLAKPDESIDVTEVSVKYGHLFKTKPRNHQLQALAKCGLREYFGYYMEPGLGKTKTVIDEAVILEAEHGLSTVGVLCPKSVISTWIEQLREHGRFDDWTVMVWNSDRRATERLSEGTGLRWLIMNYDAIATGLQTKKKYGGRVVTGDPTDSFGYRTMATFLTVGGKSMLALDESTAIVKEYSIRTQQCASLRRYAEFRRILTGTPMGHSALDIYPQLKFLDPSLVGFRNWWSFQDEYAVMGGYQGKQVVGVRKRDELKRMLKDSGFRCRTVDVINLPEPIEQTCDVFLSAANLKRYQKALEDNFVTLPTGEVKLHSGLVQMTKMQQFCDGTILDKTGTPAFIGTEKLDRLLEVVSEIGDNQFLVWCQFRAEMEAIADALRKQGIVTAQYHGDVKQKDRGAMVSSFEEGQIQALVLQNDAGHLGITLNAATYSILFSYHPRAMVYEQLRRRNWRDGQEKTVVYVHLRCPGLMDEYILESVRKNIDFNESIMGSDFARNLIKGAESHGSGKV